MVTRLIVDAARRKWRRAPFVLLQAWVIGRFCFKVWPTLDPLALTMIAAWFLHMVPGAWSQSREMSQLPVSRRTWWLARWWQSTVGASAVAVSCVALAVWSGRPESLGAEEAALSGIWAFLYCGVAMSLAGTWLGQWADRPVVEQRIHPPGTFSPVPDVNVTWLIAKAVLRVVPVMFLLVAVPLTVPLFAAPWLPHTFRAIDLPAAAVLAVMCGLTVRGYRRQPPIAARPSTRAPRADGAAPVTHASTAAASPANARTSGKPRLADRLTGLSLVAYEEGRKRFFIVSTVIVLLVTAWAVVSRFRPVPPLGEFLRLADALPFTSATARPTEPITIAVLFFILSIADVWMFKKMRPLRALPLSSTQLGCLPAGLGVLSAMVLWLVFLALHAVMAATIPVSLRPDLFLAFAGLMALSLTTRFIAPGSDVVKGMASVAPVAAIWLSLGYWGLPRPDVVQPAMFVGGLLVLGLSVAVMRHAVVHAGRLYRPSPARF